MFTAEIEHLHTFGWSRIPWPSADDLLILGRYFGEPVPSRLGGGLIDTLVPKTKEAARQKSMSALYGKAPLPFHTDSANLRVPPSLVLLRLAPGHESDRPTLIADSRAWNMSHENLQRLQNDVWLVNGGRGRFYASILSDTIVPGQILVRYDPCCMRPVTKRSHQSAAFLADAMRKNEPGQIDWTPGFAILLDNTRVLHARGARDRITEGPRALEPVLLKTRKGRPIDLEP